MAVASSSLSCFANCNQIRIQVQRQRKITQNQFFSWATAEAAVWADDKQRVYGAGRRCPKSGASGAGREHREKREKNTEPILDMTQRCSITKAIRHHGEMLFVEACGEMAQKNEWRNRFDGREGQPNSKVGCRLQRERGYNVLPEWWVM